MKKRILCFALSFLVVIGAYYCAGKEAEQVNAAIVLDDAAIIAAILASCGAVYLGNLWWQDGSAAELWDDDYAEEIGQLDDKCADIMQRCLDKAGLVDLASGFNPEEDDPNDKVPTWEKLKQWIKLHPGETIMTTGTALAAVLLNFANELKDDVDVITESIDVSGITFTSFIPSAFPFRAVMSYGSDSYYIFADGPFKINTQKAAILTVGINPLVSSITAHHGQTNVVGKSQLSGPIKSYFSLGAASTFGYSNVIYNFDIENVNDSTEPYKDNLTPETVQYGSQIQTNDDGDITALPVPLINPSALAQNWPQLLPALQNTLALGQDPAEVVDDIIGTVGAQPTTDPDTGEDPEPDAGEDTGTDTGLLDFLKAMFQKLWEFLQKILDAILGIPDAIADWLKRIFIPNTDELQDIYDDLNESVGNIFGIDNYDLDNLWSDSGPPDDIYGDLDFGSYHYSGLIVSFRFLIDGVDKFRKYIRGFVVLMLVIYNIRQALSMFGLSSGEIAAAHAYDTSHGNKYSGGGN